MLHNLIHFIDRLNTVIGRSTSWLTLLLVLVIIADVLLRYLFSVTSSASFELEWHLFAAIFLLSAGWALKEDRHVRVDVFYQQFTPVQKAWVNMVGALMLLLPLCVVGVTEGAQFAYNAYQMGETSPDPGGLPARFVIKSVIPVSFFLLGLQAISLFLASLKVLLGND